MKRTTRLSRKRFIVGIPVPSLDHEGEPLSTREVEQWVRRALEELTACFGGATPVPAPGTNVVRGPRGRGVTLYEAGQTLVLAACENRRAFLTQRRRIAAFAETMAEALRQEAVFVLGWPSESFLIEVSLPAPSGRRKE